MITIDGSQGEGGGQIVRSSLALALVTGRPVRIENVRAGRKKPGLLAQHLTAVQAAATVGRAEVRGAELGSRDLTFRPGDIVPGEYHFAVGTAGSATLVLQTVLPPLLAAARPSLLRLEGGTHNPFAPPFDFLAKAFLPLLGRMGVRVEATLVRPGFYPAGGGEIRVAITPAAHRNEPTVARTGPTVAPLVPLELLDRGAVLRTTATARVAHLPRSIAERELRVIARQLGLGQQQVRIEEVTDSRGPGNLVCIEVQCAHVTEIFSGFGQRSRPAEAVAEEVAEAARRYLAHDVPVGEHLTDQLLIPLALARGGAFRTAGLSRHAQTNIQVIECFLDVRFALEQNDAGTVVRVHPGGRP